jgi:choline dehydrogenase-like flavoprotein
MGIAAFIQAHAPVFARRIAKAVETPQDPRAARELIRAGMLAKANSPETTQFDYIVIGSGAGGGPMAARLAEGGKTVLVLEAGIDPVEGAKNSSPDVNEITKETYEVPAYHPAATEDPQVSWGFSVRHYAKQEPQGGDPKYFPTHDRDGTGGILYPRSSALGGCTAHHAMIILRPNDSDWNRIAQLTGDDSWRASSMQGYFARIEDCLYYDTYEGWLGKILFVYNVWKRIATFLMPRTHLSRGDHGRKGWQKTSFIEPSLIARIAKRDWTFVQVLLGSVAYLVKRNRHPFRHLFKYLTGPVVRNLDPNFDAARSARNGQLTFIPIGTDGKRRCGVRERLKQVATDHPDRLVIATQKLVKRIVFRKCDDGVPVATGVEVAEGFRLYDAGGEGTAGQPTRAQRFFYARKEVILCGGAFNSPQLLMLSGIGTEGDLREHNIAGPRDEAGNEVAPIVNLHGVGRNLQDRYEVSVIMQTRKEFSTLKDVTFRPGAARPGEPVDPARTQWLKDQTGMYATNGGSLSFFHTSSHAPLADINAAPGSEGPRDPDLFIFGAPAAFRGYYWNWSKQLLNRNIVKDESKQKGKDQRDLWSWLVLKAYTSNDKGTVRLRNSDPFQPPAICFNSFPPSGGPQDLDALVEGVKVVRELNSTLCAFKEEVQPAEKGETDKSLKDWIEKEAWGHHACGTCKIGAQPWQMKTSDVKGGAVIDGNFRVHGVRGLRVVDASVFPTIPGYFIVTPVFMISEKAADILLAKGATPPVYPSRLEMAEAQAVLSRRRIAAGRQAKEQSPGVPAKVPRMPENTVGLALSGGGIRSATFCLGVLQALARRNRIRDVDYLSTVSGGGYIGAFLGRLFTRFQRLPVGTATQRVQKILANLTSPELWWLRTHANYLAGEGRSDAEVNIAVIWRNLLAVHLCVGSLLVALFTLLRFAADNTLAGDYPWSVAGVGISPWWWLPCWIFVLGVFPAWFAFWLSPKPGATAAHPFFALLAWLVMLGSAVAAIRLPRAETLATIAIISLLVAWLWQEFARLGSSVGQEGEQFRGAVVRNRLTRGLGLTLGIILVALLWVLLDTASRLAAERKLMIPLVSGMGVLSIAMPVLRYAAMKLGSDKPAGTKVGEKVRNVLAGTVAFPLAAFLLFGYDVIAHSAYNYSDNVGYWALGLSLLIALVLGRASNFLNLSSLHQLYASRLARTFLGASSDARVHTSPSQAPKEVGAAHPDDDVFLYKYHPEDQGGPLHLMTVCVNETVDALSGRPIDEDKGLPFCVGPIGVSVGRRYHSLWEREEPQTPRLRERLIRSFDELVEKRSDFKTALQPLADGPDPNAFHVLAHDRFRFDSVCASPEALRLSQWIAISGAAFTPGSGRKTSLPMALLLGLFNVRLGYWWDTGIEAGERPGRFPPGFLQRVRSLPERLFRTQATLLNEWGRYFQGPRQRFWYLSDGGHIENSALYELLRRRLGFMIYVDGTHDPNYIFDDLAAMVRRARLDFGAKFEWVDPASARFPRWIRRWIKTSELATLAKLGRESPQAAALAKVTYDDEPSRTSWLLVVKGCLGEEEKSLDLRCYAKQNTKFPNDPTFNQFLTDDQWESYRLLGEQIGLRIFDGRP